MSDSETLPFRLMQKAYKDNVAGYSLESSALMAEAVNALCDRDVEILRLKELVGKAMEARRRLIATASGQMELLPHETHPHHALEHYGAGKDYDIWRAWKELVELDLEFHDADP